jgi:hypothetical protein
VRALVAAVARALDAAVKIDLTEAFRPMRTLFNALTPSHVSAVGVYAQMVRFSFLVRHFFYNFFFGGGALTAAQIHKEHSVALTLDAPTAVEEASLHDRVNYYYFRARLNVVSMAPQRLRETFDLLLRGLGHCRRRRDRRHPSRTLQRLN